jgi:hypothetical protein
VHRFIGRLLTALATGLMAAALLVGAGGDVGAQDSGSRREALARVIEKINDPDPLMRLANLEAIIARGDPTEVQLAIKATLAGADPDMRSVALRSYAATLRDLFLDARLPAEVEAKLAGADRSDTALLRTAKYVADWRRATSGRLQIRLDKLDLRSGRFTAYGMNRLAKPDERTRGEGQIVGSRMRMDVAFWAAGRCAIELSPTPALVLEGTAACDNVPRMNVSMPMY